MKLNRLIRVLALALSICFTLPISSCNTDSSRREDTKTTSSNITEASTENSESTSVSNQPQAQPDDYDSFTPVGSFNAGGFLDFRDTDLFITMPENDTGSVSGSTVRTAEIYGRNIDLPHCKIVYYSFNDNNLIYRTELYATNQAILESEEFITALKTVMMQLRVVKSEDEADEVINKIYTTDGPIIINGTYYELDRSIFLITIVH